jgi:hypothetical protein
MKISMEAPQKLKINLVYNPAIPLLDIYLKECKSIYKSGTCMFTFILALFTITELWNHLSPTSDE